MTAHRRTSVVFAAFIFNIVAAISAYAAEATFSWTANEITPAGYNIHYGYESGDYDFVVDVGLPEVIDGSIIKKVEGLSAGKTYYFAATAYTATEESDYSTEVVYTTPGVSTPDPLVPSDTAEATFSWTANEITPLGYKIHYGTESKTYGSVVDVGLPEAIDGVIIKKVEGLSNGQTYYFAATAYTATEESDFSTEVVYTTPEGNTTPDPLIANDLSLQGVEDSIISGTVVTNAAPGDSLTFIVDPLHSFGTATFQGNQGAFTFTPPLNFNGDVSFTFTVSNGTETSSPATVTLSVSPSNDKPTAQAKTIAVNEDGSFSGTLSASDIDGDNLTYSLATSASSGEVAINNNDGSFSYHPQANYSGSDSFTFFANDGKVSSNAATVTITVASVNDAPLAEDLAISVAEDGSYSGHVTGSDVDENTLTFTVTNTPLNGEVQLNANGSYTYTPDPDYSGTDSFSYKASDGTLLSNPATVSITVTSVNDAPLAEDLAISVVEDGEYSSHVTGSDVDENTLTFTVTNTPLNGEVQLNANGSYTYTPDPDYSGTDSFSYKASDGTLLSNPATVSITVTSVNDAPLAEDLAISVAEDGSYSGYVTGSDVDGNDFSFFIAGVALHGSVELDADGSFIYTPDSNYSGSDSFGFKVSDGSLSSAAAAVSITITDVNNAPVAAGQAISLDENSTYSDQLLGDDADGDALEFILDRSAAHGTLTLDPNGEYTYSPEPNFSGEDNFTFYVSDGSTTSNIATVTVAITEVAHEFAMELGELELTSEWKYFDFQTTFVNPAIIVHSTTASSNTEVLITIKNLTSTGFEIRLDSWDYENSPVMSETISYLAMEQGYHQIEDDVHVIADCAEISGGNSFQPVMFSSALPTVPVVLSSIVTNNETEGVTLRLTDINQHGFSVAMQEQESSNQLHSNEQVCFIAWEKWTGLMDDVLVEVDVLPTTLTDIEATVSFQQQFPEIPMTLAGMQSANGMDTATLETTNLAVNEMSLHVLEEQSDNDEIEHTDETAGYFALVPYVLTEDSDHDGLSNADEQASGTHPGLFDSDYDGINDGLELQFLSDNNLGASTDSDEDGLIDLLDSDSDNDGLLDGEEIAQGSDPTDPESIPEAPDTIIDNDPSAFRFELGEIPVAHESVSITFDSEFTEPVIIANAVTRNGSSPFTIGITNVTSNGFDIHIKEYNYLDGIHNQEIVSYIVMEKGSHILEDGSIVEAGLFEASGETSEIFFVSQFSVAPVVFTSALSINDEQAVAGRTWDVNTLSFMHKLQRQESNTTSHGIETVAYLAWTPGVSSADGMKFEVGRTSDSVKNKDYEIQLSQNFANLPFHFAGMQTKDGGDTSLAKITQAEENKLTVRVEEEQSKNSETYHTKEIVGFLVVLPE